MDNEERKLMSLIQNEILNKLKKLDPSAENMFREVIQSLLILNNQCEKKGGIKNVKVALKEKTFNTLKVDVRNYFDSVISKAKQDLTIVKSCKMLLDICHIIKSLGFHKDVSSGMNSQMNPHVRIIEEANKDAYSYYIKAGNSHLSNNHNNKALECYKAALSISKDSGGGVYFKIAKAYSNLKDQDAAFKYYSKSGELFEKEKEYGFAIDCYQHAINIKKDDALLKRLDSLKGKNSKSGNDYNFQKEFKHAEDVSKESWHDSKIKNAKFWAKYDAENAKFWEESAKFWEDSAKFWEEDAKFWKESDEWWANFRAQQAENDKYWADRKAEDDKFWEDSAKLWKESDEWWADYHARNAETKKNWTNIDVATIREIIKSTVIESLPKLVSMIANVIQESSKAYDVKSVTQVQRELEEKVEHNKIQPKKSITKDVISSVVLSLNEYCKASDSVAINDQKISLGELCYQSCREKGMSEQAAILGEVVCVEEIDAAPAA